MPPVADYLFRQLRDDEESLGYEVVCSGLDLEVSLRPLDFLYPYPREHYAAHHSQGENFGLFRDGALVACVSLGLLPAMEWRWGFAGPLHRVPVLAQLANRARRPRLRQPCLWLSKLVVGDVPRRGGLGRRTVRSAVQHAARQGARFMYFQASSRDDLLTRYYRTLGFRELRRMPARDGFDWVLFEGNVSELLTRQASGRTSVESSDHSEKSR